MARPAAGIASGWLRPRRQPARAYVALVLAALIGACSNLPLPTSAQRSAWSGRFALAVGPQSLTLDLVSPLGATIARFETDPSEARLLVPSDGGLRIARGADAQELSEQVLGWSLPIEGMADWVEGRPSSTRPFRRLPAEDGAERFEQDGWSVTVERIADAKLGRRVQMERAARDGLPSVALRVVLDAPAS